MHLCTYLSLQTILFAFRNSFKQGDISMFMRFSFSSFDALGHLQSSILLQKYIFNKYI